ncbi:MAG: hypothetical protein K2Q09_11925 [Phycisphaerales bacterium]|nr:hypothetical protein [Phycisphaerales bacterium]
MPTSIHPFDRPSAPVRASRAVAQLGARVTEVLHDADTGEWRFSAGANRVEPDHDLVAVPLHQLVTADPTLATVERLPPGWLARRADATRVWTLHPQRRALLRLTHAARRLLAAAVTRPSRPAPLRGQFA